MQHFDNATIFANSSHPDVRDLQFNGASTNDSPAIAELLITCDLPADDLDEQLSNLTVIRHEEALIATIGLETYADIGLLRSLAVAPSWRGRGIADALCRDLEYQATKNGIRQLFLLTTTAADFFGRRGWLSIDRDRAPEAIRATSQFSALCPASATFMTLLLK